MSILVQKYVVAPVSFDTAIKYSHYASRNTREAQISIALQYANSQFLFKELGEYVFLNEPP